MTASLDALLDERSDDRRQFGVATAEPAGQHRIGVGRRIGQPALELGELLPQRLG